MQNSNELMDSPAPLPFITFSPSSGFTLTEEAEKFLSSLDPNRKLGLISVVGKYRTGKSFFINRVLLEKEGQGFKVGSTVNACTKGLWLWKEKLSSDNPEHKDMDILIIDTEGFGGTEENVNHDSKIFIFSLLLSSYFIYNSVGNIDENTLNSLAVIINLAKDIQVKSSKNENEDASAFFPSFLWVVRDFALKLVSKEGEPIQPKEYLENALDFQKGLSDSVESKNRIRRLFKHFFKDRDCITLVRPCEKESDLQRINEIPNEKLRPEFVNQSKSFHTKLMKKIRPKTMNGKCLNGEMLIGLCKAYVEAINKGGVPVIETAWKYVVKTECAKNMEASLDFIDKKFSELEKEQKFFDQDEMKKIKKEILENAINFFKKRAIGEEADYQEYFDMIKKDFSNKFKSFKVNCLENLQKNLTSQYQTEIETLENNLDNDSYNNFFEFEFNFSKMINEWKKSRKSSLVFEKFISDVSSKLFKSAAEKLSSKVIKSSDQELKSCKLQLTLLEEELRQNKEKFQSEKNYIQTLFAQNENDLASFKIKNADLSQKLSLLSTSNSELLSQLAEYQAKNIENESNFNFESEQLKNELEKQFDLIKDEYLTLSCENEKKIALLEQEVVLKDKENSNLRENLEILRMERNELKAEIENLEVGLENARKEVTDKESQRTMEVGVLKAEFEKQIKELAGEKNTLDGKEKSKGEYNSFMIEKTYMENQIKFLNSQLEETKKMYEGVLVLLQKNLSNPSDSQETNELLETNRNLSTTMEIMNARCKAQEEKIKDLKQYKPFYNRAAAFQCSLCSAFISKQQFLKHIANCEVNNTSIYSNLSTIQTNFINETQIQGVKNQQKPRKHQSIHYDNEFPLMGNNEKDMYEDLELELEQELIKESQGKYCCLFTIYCKLGRRQWKVIKKNSQFYEFFQNLMLSFPGLDISLEFNFSLEEKKREIEKTMLEISKIDVVKNSELFRQFLEIDRINLESSNATLRNVELQKSKTISKNKAKPNIELNMNPVLESISAFNLNNSPNNNKNERKIKKHKNNLTHLIDKNFLPVSPRTYLENWNSNSIKVDLQRQKKRRISDIQIGDYYPFECSEILETPKMKGLNDTVIENKTPDYFNSKNASKKKENSIYRTPASIRRSQNNKSNSTCKKNMMSEMRNIVDLKKEA